MNRTILTLITIVAAHGCAPADDGTATSSQSARAVAATVRATPVEVAVVEPSSAVIETRLPGEVVGSQDALLAAAMGGFVERVLVQEGDEVQRGQVLVRVDTAATGARTAQARVEVSSAERELARAENLGGAISAQARDQAENRVAAARAMLRVARVASSRSVVRAPFAGTIAEVAIEPGEVAAPGVPLVRLVRLSPVHVSLSVPDRDVGSFTAGMTVQVRAGATGQRLEGTVERVSPAANLQTRAFEIRVALPNENRALLPGMIAEVVFSHEAAQGQLILPQHVLVTGLEENGVFIEEDGIARWRPLEVGRVVRNQVVILAGLEVGERVVVNGHRELAEGDPLHVMREGICCTDGRPVFGDVAVEPARPSEDPPQRTPNP